MLRLFPLLAIPLGLYNLLALGGAITGHPDLLQTLAMTRAIYMFSGDVWKVSVADLFLLLGLFLLFVEMIKSTRGSSSQLINHGLSMLTFVIALIEFIVLKGFANSTFFFLMLLMLFDTVAGYTISIVAAEHNLGLTRVDRD